MTSDADELDNCEVLAADSAATDENGRNLFRLEILKQLNTLPPPGWEKTTYASGWRDFISNRDNFIREAAADEHSRPQSHYLTMAGWHLLMAARALIPKRRRTAARNHS